MFKFDNDLNIASLSSDDKWNKFKVLTIIQSNENPLPSIRAYLGARYSRSADSIADIAQEVLNKNIDASMRLETIFHGYGHRSVGDMADVFVCIERVPMLFAQRFFNHNAVISGQERSTRFQNFQDPQFVKLPNISIKTASLQSGYNDIMNKSLGYYRKLLPETKAVLKKFFNINIEDKLEAKALEARSFDTARYFLPVGLETSFAAVMSARSWSESIGFLRGSNWHVDKNVGKLIYSLLSGDISVNKEYNPEVKTLIRHAEENKTRRDSTNEVLDHLFKSKISWNKNVFKYRIDESFQIDFNVDPASLLLTHYIELIDEEADGFKNDVDSSVFAGVGDILAKYHSHFSNIGNIAQTGAIRITGWADYGSIKDLNRHRSFERFIPFYEEEFDIENIITRDIDKNFTLCDYLFLGDRNIVALRNRYEKGFMDIYNSIFNWYYDAKTILDRQTLSEFTRYLLPHAQVLRYNFYASIDDLLYTISLRTRPGGHISYRNLTYKWLLALKNKSALWNGLFNKIPSVEVSSRDQFINRS